MGWLFFHKDRNLPTSLWFKEHLTYEGEHFSYKPLATSLSKYGRVGYAAVEITNRNTLDKEVIAFVYLFNYFPSKYHNFGYKDMDETMGPVESNCPMRLLKLLTPTDNKWANEWRERCWNRYRKK